VRLANLEQAVQYRAQLGVVGTGDLRDAAEHGKRGRTVNSQGLVLPALALDLVNPRQPRTEPAGGSPRPVAARSCEAICTRPPWRSTI
jgi:hypothetical protein